MRGSFRLLVLLMTFGRVIPFVLSSRSNKPVRNNAGLLGNIEVFPWRKQIEALSMVVEAPPKQRTPTQNFPFRTLKPLPATGKWEGENMAVFLGPEKMDVKAYGDGFVTKGLLSVVVPSTELEASLESAIAKHTGSKLSVFSRTNGQVITDRDRGIFDNLFNCPLLTTSRKEMYDAIRFQAKNYASPYHSLIAMVQKKADVVITGLMVELADRPTSNSIRLGATVLVARVDVAKNWLMMARNTDEILKEVKKSEDAFLVNCYMDELVGLAFATNLPVIIPVKWYEPIAVNGLLEQKGEGDNKKLFITAPFFGSIDSEQDWRKEVSEKREEAIKEGMIEGVRPLDVPNATTYLRWTVADKRASLRAASVEIPRPREGPRALDAYLIPLLDPEVAYEVLRRLAETNMDFEAAAKMDEFESKKPQLAREIARAEKAGDYVRVKQLMNEINNLAVLDFDPTDPDNPDGKGWDVEEWYWQQRRKYYDIVA